MELLQEKPVSCPYCGEAITVLIDCTLSRQEYIEDCEVCCRPIIFRVTVADGEDVHVETFREDE